MFQLLAFKFATGSIARWIRLQQMFYFSQRGRRAGVRVGQELGDTIYQGDIADRTIDQRRSFGLALPVTLGQSGLWTLRQHAFERRQEDDTLKVLADCGLRKAAEAFDFKDVFDAVVVGLAAPAPAVDLLEFGARITLLIAQGRQQHFRLA